MKRIFLLSLLMMATPTAPVQADTVVAAHAIRGATLIGPQDLAMVPDTIPGALQDPERAIGMEARVNLYPGRPIRASDLQSPAVIDRNDIVSLRFSANGLVITTDGRALDRAAEGEQIRILNLSSRVTVTATALGPGMAQVGALP